MVVARATARPVCDALALAMRRYGVPEQILTDNGKVFTARFGPGPGPVLFDRICRENGIRHLLTAPRSPTTTGKVERWHKTLRAEFLDRQGVRDDRRRPGRSSTPGCSTTTTSDRTSRSAMVAAVGTVPARRTPTPAPADADADAEPTAIDRAGDDPAGGRATGTISFATASYKAGRVAGRPDRRGRLRRRAGAAATTAGCSIATHARRHPVDKQTAGAATRHAGPPPAAARRRRRRR